MQKAQLKIVAEPDPEAAGMLISEEQLRRLGDGDVREGRRLLRLLMADERDSRHQHRGPTAKPESVRMATREDEINILALLIDDARNTVGHLVPIDPSRILDHIMLGTRGQGGFVGVIDADDVSLAAVTVIMPVQSKVSRAYFLQQLFDVVHPDHRKTRHGLELMNFGKWLSDQMTEKFGYLVPLVGEVNAIGKIREKVRFYRRHMTQVGGSFIYPTLPGM